MRQVVISSLGILAIAMRIVVALGGNALIQRGMKGTFAEQQSSAAAAAAQLAQLVKEGYHLVVTHGNGPQCGAIFMQNANCESTIPAMPLHVCGAMSQGFLGELIQQQLDSALKAAGVPRHVVSIVTQSYVDKADPAFRNPSKPIGQFYTIEEAERLRRERGYNIMEDSGRGYRIAVPSPMPTGFVEAEAIKLLVDNDFICICSGGGGIPVIEENGAISGVEAVIDKDFGASVLAELVDAEAFLILTDVREVMINYRKENEQALREVTVEELNRYIRDGQFGRGSMLPKVQACARFAERTGRPAFISSLENALQALRGECGTRIVASAR